ncbi:copper resistance CopC family protein [Nocardiopsis alkaliphila]|uniref:copper resistance CopC family protein n=1 Tax=Nocardiopsis alkaliphila TaxID=225762 RepID=UPI00034A6D77|nr:copper resistance CopC family protein [Nocardiopsis alkaliphila]
MRKLRTATLITPLAAAALLLAPSPALAHDVLIASDPEDGATLETVPEEVLLTFNNSPAEGGGGSAIVVTGPDGETQYEDGELTFDGPNVSVDLAPLDEAGEYDISYRVVSSDGHPIQDTLTFTVTEEAITAAAPEEPVEEEEEPTETEQPAEEVEESPAAAEEPAAESGSGTMLLLGGVATLAVIGLIVILVVRMRKRPGSTE